MTTPTPVRTTPLGGYRDVAGRLQFLLTPTENLSGRFKVHIRDFDGTPRLFRANVIKPGRADLVPGFRRNKIAP